MLRIQIKKCFMLCMSWGCDSGGVTGCLPIRGSVVLSQGPDTQHVEVSLGRIIKRVLLWSFSFRILAFADHLHAHTPILHIIGKGNHKEPYRAPLTSRIAPIGMSTVFKCMQVTLDKASVICPATAILVIIKLVISKISTYRQNLLWLMAQKTLLLDAWSEW